MATLFLGGRDRPLAFGAGTLARCEKLTGLSAKKLSRKMVEGSVSVSEIITLIFCGLESGARAAGEKVDFTLDDVCAWIDQAGTQTMWDAIQICADDLNGIVKNHKNPARWPRSHN